MTSLNVLGIRLHVDMTISIHACKLVNVQRQSVLISTFRIKIVHKLFMWQVQRMLLIIFDHAKFWSSALQT